MMKLFLTIITIILFAGCSSKPSDSEIVNQAKDHFQKLFDTDADVVDIKKLNGIKNENGTYQAHISFNLKYNINWSDLDKALKLKIKKDPFDFTDARENYEAIKSFHRPPFKVGDTRAFSDKANFIKTEKGWKLSEMEGTEPI